MSFIKKIQSYFHPINIDSFKGESSRKVTLSLLRNNYILTSDSIYYSVNYNESIFSEVFKLYGITQKKDFKKVLILGFGIGTVAEFINNKIQFNCQIRAYEEEKIFLNIAEKYFHSDKYTNIKVINNSIRDIVNETNTYDLIIIDLFDEKQIRSIIEDAHFFNIVKKQVNFNGFIIVNLNVSNTPLPLVNQIKKSLISVFNFDIDIINFTHQYFKNTVYIFFLDDKKNESNKLKLRLKNISIKI